MCGVGRVGWARVEGQRLAKLGFQTWRIGLQYQTPWMTPGDGCEWKCLESSNQHKDKPNPNHTKTPKNQTQTTQKPKKQKTQKPIKTTPKINQQQQSFLLLSKELHNDQHLLEELQRETGTSVQAEMDGGWWFGGKSSNYLLCRFMVEIVEWSR